QKSATDANHRTKQMSRSGDRRLSRYIAPPLRRETSAFINGSCFRSGFRPRLFLSQPNLRDTHFRFGGAHVRIRGNPAVATFQKLREAFPGGFEIRTRKGDAVVGKFRFEAVDLTLRGQNRKTCPEPRVESRPLL